MKTLSGLSFLVLFVLIGCRNEETRTDERNRFTGADLMEADRAFAAATRTAGLEGWMSYMAEDAVRLPALGTRAVRGKTEIAALDGGFFADSTRRLLWEPVDAGLFADGRHGYTTGRYTLEQVKPDTVEVTGTGAYVTWWRLEPDGAWRVILDGGSSDSTGT